jgi:Domain of unknown function (DUF4136)
MKFINRFTFLATLLCTAVLLLVPYARSQEVHYNYARGTNFSGYKTYQWVEVPSRPQGANVPNGAPKFDLPAGGPFGDLRSGGGDDELIRQEIQRAVDEQLAQKGLTKVEKDGDLLVTYQAAVREEKSINLFGSGYRGFGGAGGFWDGSVQGQTSTIPVGTLVVALYDSAKKQMVWRGDASKSIDLKKDQNKNYKNLQKAMTKLFKNYPPQQK